MGKKRAEYSENLKWNVKDLFTSKEAYEEEYQALEQDLAKYAKFKGHILDSATNLLELLEFDTSFNKRIEQIFVYAHIQNDQDTTDTNYQTMFGKTYNLYEKYVATTSFITPEILKKDYQLIEKYIQEKPELQAYSRTLKELFKYQKYTLSAKEESLISNLVSVFKTPDDVYSLLTDADMTFGQIKNDDNIKEELTEKSYRKFIESTNRRVRKQAFTKLLTTYSHFKNTYASLLMAEVKNSNKIANIRGYQSSLHAALYQNDIPTEIYTNLITTVKKNIKPLSDFWQLKKEMLNVKSLHLYDTYAPITKEINHQYSVSAARDLLYQALAILGDTYITDLKQAFDNRWIDFCSNDGKRNGAYCTNAYNVHPYVLLSYDGSLNNVSTLAHELGHAMHYYYASKYQKYQDYNYSIFVAEVASQVNQILLSKYLIAHTSNKEEKKYLIDDLISDFKATIYRQTMFAEFEKIIHEEDEKGNILTHEDLSNIYYKLNQEYFGKNIVIDDIIKYEWERIPHFYMNFYVYQYATAYAAAIKIAMDILNHKDKAQEQYLEFLKLGCTKTPIESLKVAGVDMTKPETLNEAFAYFEDLIKELNSLK